MSRFSFQCDSLPDSAHVVSFRGEEGLSMLYRFEIALLIPDSDCASLVLDDVIGARATLTLQPQDDSPASDQHPIRGMLAEIELVHSEGGKTLLAATLVPALYRLSQSFHSRMFTGQTVPDIITWILEQSDLGAQLDMRLSADHPEEEHVCQYHETDYDFISRWMEREGIYFYFDHSGDEEKIVVTDHKATHDASRESGVRFRPVAVGDATASESLTEFRAVHRALPASVRIQDYDMTRPSLDVSAEAAVSSEGQGQVVIHEARCFSPEDAERLVEIRAEERLWTGSTFETGGTVFGVRSGYTFSLEEHVQSDLNQDYLVTRVTHEGAQSAEAAQVREMLGHDMADGYALRATVLPADVQYRHRSTTAWPRIRGIELGVIDGEADSDYAQLDEHGRYLVRFHFDESDLADGSTSTRVRMMQPHGGALEGFHFPLRKGTEVVLAFLGGDPDRPVIAGAVPNAHNPSTVTADNHTQNVIQTGGRTRIEVEDQEGQQHVYIYTPPEETYFHIGEPFNPTHNLVLKTKADALYEIGKDQKIEVGGQLDEQVKKNVSETYSDKQESTVDASQHTTVHGDVTEIYGATQKTTVKSGPRVENFDDGQTTIVAGAREETFQAGQTQQVFGNATKVFVGPYQRKVTGHTHEFHVGTLTEVVAGGITEVYPSGVKEKYGPTKGVYANLKWFSPNIHIDAPNWSVTTPSKFRIIGDFKDCGVLKYKAELLSTGTTGLKLERVGMATGVTGAKVEATGIAIGVNGPVLCAGGLKLELGIFKSEVLAIKKYLP